MLLVLWDHTVLPATRCKWTNLTIPASTPARGRCSIYRPRRHGLDMYYRKNLVSMPNDSAHVMVTSVGCRFRVQNLSDADADLSRHQNY